MAGQDQKFSIAKNAPYAPDKHKRQVALSLAGTIAANDSSESDNLTTVGEEDTRFRIGDGDARKFSDSQESLLSRRGKTEYSSYCDMDTHGALNLIQKAVKGVLLSRLLDHALPEVRDATEGFCASSGGPNTCITTVVSSLSSSKNGTRNMAGKRARKDGKDPGDIGGDDSDDGNDGRPKKKASSDRIPPRRLKCPFHQRQPERYTKAACRGEGFAEMGKLKDHLKRVHMHPLRCLRCHVEMSEEELEDHLDRDDICARLPAPQDDRIAPQKLWRVHFKKAPFMNARSTEEKWKIMYKMLFPADSEADIPSPYDQNTVSPNLARALTEALEEELNQELAQYLEPVVTRIKARIPAIIERCRANLAQRATATREDINVEVLSTRSKAIPEVISNTEQLHLKDISSQMTHV